MWTLQKPVSSDITTTLKFKYIAKKFLCQVTNPCLEIKSNVCSEKNDKEFGT